MQGTSKQIRRAFRYAFPHTIPIFAGFWFLGITYGVYMNVSGFSFVYPMLMSMTIFTGSMEFVTVNMLLSGFHPLQAFVMAILVGARHLFYGISMLDKFRGMGWKKFFLIYGMCDETFSINYSAEIPENVDRGWFMFFVTVLNYSYWVTGATFGGLFGSLIHFNTQGLDFAMTAMFVVIFYGAVDERQKTYESVCRFGCIGIVSGNIWRRQLYGADHVCDFILFDGSPQKKRGGAGMTVSQQIITIAIIVVGTELTRFLPFLIFPAGKPTPNYIQYLGKVLPAAVFGMIVIYCLRNVSVFTGSHGIPELLAIAVTAGLHLWRRQILLSIAGGTICYMILVQMVFAA